MLTPVLDPDKLLHPLVDWCTDLLDHERAPGLLIGISGTDSALAFWVCAQALKRLGRLDRLRGVHFGPVYPPVEHAPQALEQVLRINPSYRWVQRCLMPWLQEQAPGAQLVVEPDPAICDDHRRWAALLAQSVGTLTPTETYRPEGTYWVVGTRNATEQALGA
jgi:hypothetical protein